MSPIGVKAMDGKGKRPEPQTREKYPNPFPASQLVMLTLDGEWVEMLPPRLEDLTKHARRYGCNQVAETAVAMGYDLERTAQVVNLLDEIAPLHSKERRDKTWWQGYANRKASAEDKALALHGLKRCDDCRAKEGKVEECETCMGSGHVPRGKKEEHVTEPTEVEDSDEPASDEDD